MIDPFTKTRFDPHLRLETWYPEGVLDHPMAAQMASYLGFTERTMDEPFKRFTDLSNVTSIRLDFADISSIAAERREAYKERPPSKVSLLSNQSGGLWSRTDVRGLDGTITDRSGGIS